jgi:hypothetical protein
MGITATDVDILFDLSRREPSIARIATIGRLTLYLHSWQVDRLKELMPKSDALAGYRWGDNADQFLRDLTGATEIVSIDISDYEGASIVHDMNAPFTSRYPNLADNFDLVIDGGTLEHIFNFPVAIINMMFLVRKGGYIISSNPANNLCGHGFYQFTPELMYRIYSRENGFKMHRVVLTQARHTSVEMDSRPRSYEVVDPATLGRRILVRNKWPIMIRTLAERVGDQLPTVLDVQQSDYVAARAGSTNPRAHSDIKKILRKAYQKLPRTVQSRIFDVVGQNTLGNRRAMRRWRGVTERRGTFSK